MPELTRRQSAVYSFILAHCEKHGAAPSLREIADRFGLSQTGAVGHVKALQKKGRLTKGGKGLSRGIRPTCSYTVKAVKGRA